MLFPPITKEKLYKALLRLNKKKKNKKSKSK